MHIDYEVNLMHHLMKQHLYFLLLIATVAFLFICCGAKTEPSNEEKTEYKSYYFPIEELRTPKVYRYSSENTNDGDMYWVMSTVAENNQTYLLTDAYTLDSMGNLNHIELVKEAITDKGAFVKEYSETQRNQHGQTFQSVVTMESDGIFLWDLKTDKEIIWKFKSVSKAYPDFENETYRERMFTGTHTTITFHSKETPAILLTDSFKIHFNNRSTKQQEAYDFSQTSYYAKGIGLYKFTRVFPDRQVTVILKEILSLDEWEKIKLKTK